MNRRDVVAFIAIWSRRSDAAGCSSRVGTAWRRHSGLHGHSLGYTHGTRRGRCAAPHPGAPITAIGISIILQHLAMMIWGRNPLPFPRPSRSVSFEIGGAIIKHQIAII